MESYILMCAHPLTRMGSVNTIMMNIPGYSLTNFEIVGLHEYYFVEVWNHTHNHNVHLLHDDGSRGDPCRTIENEVAGGICNQSKSISAK